jgi:hypothetical protein
MKRMTPLEVVQSCYFWASEKKEPMTCVPTETVGELLSQLKLADEESETPDE